MSFYTNQGINGLSFPNLYCLTNMLGGIFSQGNQPLPNHEWIIVIAEIDKMEWQYYENLLPQSWHW
jgi:hypothetical protein